MVKKVLLDGESDFLNVTYSFLYYVGKYEDWSKVITSSLSTNFGNLTLAELNAHIGELTECALNKLQEENNLHAYPAVTQLLENRAQIQPIIVVKTRRIDTIDGVKVEQSKLQIGNSPRLFRTISIEGSNLEKLKAVRRELKEFIADAIDHGQTASYPKYLFRNGNLL